MKALITGAGGQLGRELQRMQPDDWQIIALDRISLDITDRTVVTAMFNKYHPDLVINTAAYTSVDKAESEKDRVYEVNANGAANIAKACEENQSRLIHISTDFVFDGSKCRPYTPDDMPNPINSYGASKHLGEQAVLDTTMNKALILRTGWVYSINGNNFVKTMLRLMAERDKISVVADQIGTPTWTGDLAQAIWHFAGKPDAQGIYHWTDAGVASWYDFAAAIQEEAYLLSILENLIPIVPIITADYPTPAKRPHYSVLDKTATWDILGYHSRHWKKSLKMMLTNLKEQNNG